MRRLTRWLRLRNHQIRSVARNAFQHRSGHSQKGRIDGCHTREDLIERYERLDRIYDEAQRTGTLRPHGSVNETRGEQGGILVHIARDGTPLRDGGGMHRFAIAYVLDLQKVPAQLGVIHSEAVQAGVMAELRKGPVRR